MQFPPGINFSPSASNTMVSSRTRVSTPQGTRVFNQPPVSINHGPRPQLAGPNVGSTPQRHGPIMGPPPFQGSPVDPNLGGPQGGIHGVHVGRNGIQLPGVSVGPNGVHVQGSFGRLPMGMPGRPPMPLAHSMPPMAQHRGAGAPGLPPGHLPQRGPENFGPNGPSGPGSQMDFPPMGPGPSFGGPQGFRPNSPLPDIRLPGLDLNTLAQSGKVEIHIHTSDSRADLNGAGRSDRKPLVGAPNFSGGTPFPRDLEPRFPSDFDSPFHNLPGPFGSDAMNGPQRMEQPNRTARRNGSESINSSVQSQLNEITELMTTLVMVSLVSAMSSSEGGLDPMMSGLLMDMVGTMDPGLAGMVGGHSSSAFSNSDDPLAALFKGSKKSSDPLAALFGPPKGDPLAGLFGGGGSDPLAGLLADLKGLDSFDVKGLNPGVIGKPSTDDKDPLGILLTQMAKDASTSKA